jgi:hypothetical protein
VAVSVHKNVDFDRLTLGHKDIDVTEMQPTSDFRVRRHRLSEADQLNQDKYEQVNKLAASVFRRRDEIHLRGLKALGSY